MVALRRSLVLTAAALLVWRMATTGMSAHYVERLKGGDEGAAVKALAWNGRQPEALYRQAIASPGQDTETTADLLARAHGENPADPRALIAMSNLAQAQGDQARSEALIETAVKLVPSDPWVQQRAAAYWSSRGDLLRALEHWSLALETDPSTRENLFPIFLKLAEDPRTRPAFKQLAALPPAWWEAFFKEAAAKALDVETVRVLYALRRESSRAPITRAERQAYVARLKKDGITAEAYVHWINGLSREQRSHLALLYDGGFELEPENWGFDWQVRSSLSALVYRGHTYGIDGETALHLLFDNHKGRFKGLSQALFLDPGPYRLAGRVRTDSLETPGGLKWLLRCLLPERKDLGESERFLGSNEWRDFRFEFEVPDSCVLQEIRLVSAGRRAFEYKITGDAWFDRLSIGKIAKLARAPNTELEGAASDTEAAAAGDLTPPPNAEAEP